MPRHYTDVATHLMLLTPYASSLARRRNGSTERLFQSMVVLLEYTRQDADLNIDL